MFNELIALTFVPSLINPEFLARNGSLYHSITTNQTSTEALAEQFLDELILGTDNSTEIDESPFNSSYGVRQSNDPLLDQINKEIEALHLEFSEDELDALENNSEEVRKLIESRQNSHNYNSLNSNEYTRHRESRDVDHNLEIATSTAATTASVTQFPLLAVSESSPTTLATKPPTVIPGIPKESASIIGTLKKPFEYIGGFYNRLKKGNTETTTTTTTPVYSNEDKIVEIVTETTTESMVSASLAQPLTILNCTAAQTEFNGQCVNVFTRHLCPSSTQWLVEDPITLKGKCVENPCHKEPSKAFFGGKCVVAYAEKNEVCHPGMTTYLFKSGIVICDCNPGHLYNERDGNCYPAFRKEPCGTAQYFIVPKKRNEKDVPKPMCMPNPCKMDDYFCSAPSCPANRGCVKLSSKCGEELRGNYVVDPKTNTPKCDIIDGTKVEPVIGNVPTLSCAPGSRRDILGNCRAPTEISFS